MATKRMFDKAIIDLDKFMDLSMSSKALYFLLGMEADDEGFVSFKKVMRIHGGNEDDLKILIVKKFLIPFNSGVVVITDWNKNNWLDSRRIKPTEYQNEKKLLTNKDGSYVLLSECLASIEESSIEEKRREENVEQVPPPKFSLKEELEKMNKDKRKHIRIIAYFIFKRKIKLSSKEELSETIKRHSRAAVSVSKFKKEKILSAFEECEKMDGIKYTLETLLRVLTK